MVLFCITMLPFSGWSQSVKMGKRANHAAAYNQFKSSCGGNVLNPFLNYKDDYHVTAMDCITHDLKPVKNAVFGNLGGGESQNIENLKLIVLREMAFNNYTLSLVKPEDEPNVADEIDTEAVVRQINTSLAKKRYLSKK